MLKESSSHTIAVFQRKGHRVGFLATRKSRLGDHLLGLRRRFHIAQGPLLLLGDGFCLRFHLLRQPFRKSAGVFVQYTLAY